MAFGAGTMIAAASTELFEPAFHAVAAWHAGLALLAGAGTYVLADHVIDQKLGTAAVGWGLMLGSLLDGIPENTALGVSLGEAGGVVLLVAIAVGNTPEAIGSAAKCATSRAGAGRRSWVCGQRQRCTRACDDGAIPGRRGDLGPVTSPRSRPSPAVPRSRSLPTR